MGFDLDSIEGYIANHLRLFIFMAAGIVCFVGIVAVSVFFFSIRGAEQTMVPDVVGQELSVALLELQSKELYPRLQLRYSQNPEEKGLVLEQEPRPGSIVKAGRRIRIVVSQGTMISRVETYLGKNIDELRLELQTLFASESGNVPLLSIKEPLMYIHSADAAGTILQQSPEPGTGISGPTLLELVVSRGPEDTLISVPSLVSLSVDDALEEIGRTGIDFTFIIGSLTDDIPMTVRSQIPDGGVVVSADTRISITVNPPAFLDPGEVFSLFRYPMARSPYPMSVRLEAQLPSGEIRRLLATEYPGGELTVPYNLPAESVLVLYLLNREIHRQTVSSSSEPLLEIFTLDQF